MTTRRFPPPWSVEELNDACFVVRDHNGQALSYGYYEEEPGRRTAATVAMLVWSSPLILLGVGTRSGKMLRLPCGTADLRLPTALAASKMMLSITDWEALMKKMLGRGVSC